MKSFIGAHKNSIITVVSIAFAIAVLVNKAEVREANSDPRCTLLTSQSILEYGTIKLNGYRSFLLSIKGCVRAHNGNPYDYFPLGTSLISLPAVAVANAMGLSMDINEDNEKVQTWMATFIVPSIFLLFFFTGRFYVHWSASLIISLSSVLGSSIASSLGAALWNQSLCTLLIAYMLFIIAKHNEGPQKINPYLLGVLLFLAYLTRPTASIFIIMVFTYFLIKDRGVLYRSAAVSFLLLIAFAAFSHYEYGQILPPYYSHERLNSETPLVVALYGIFLSPSRGLLVFSPFLVVTVGIAIYLRHAFKNNILLMLILLWIVLHALILGLFPNWSVGWSFGARALTDSFPAWVLISFILWNIYTKRIKDIRKVWAVACIYLTLATVGVFINTWQGLYNPWVQNWNTCMGKYDNANTALFSWSNSQIFATQESVRKLCAYSHMDDLLRQEKPITCETIDTMAREYLFLGKADVAFEAVELGESLFPDCAQLYSTKGLIFLKSPDYREMGCRNLIKACALGNCDNIYTARARDLCE